MKILVFVKQVPDTETRFKIEGGKIQSKDIKFTVNPFDEFAIEEALKLKEANAGSTVTIITMGAKKCESSIRECLAKDCDDGIHILTGDDEEFDAGTIASVLAKTAEKTGYDVIFAGKYAIDDNDAQVPARVAQILGIPFHHAAVKFEYSADSNSVNVVKESEAGSETWKLSLPAMITAEKGLNEPRYTSLKGRMAAKKKKIEVMPVADLLENAPESTVQVEKFYFPPSREQGIKIVGDDVQENVKKLVEHLKNDNRKII